MIDNFLRNLVEKEWKADSKRFGFLDVLLVFCATFFSMLIRLQLKDYSLTLYRMGGNDEAKMYIAGTNAIRLAEAFAALLLAVIMGILLYQLTRSMTRAALAYTVVLFLPDLIVNGGMRVKLDVIPVVFLVLAGVFIHKRKPLFTALTVFAGGICSYLIKDFLTLFDTGPSAVRIIGFGPFEAEYKKAACLLFLFLLLSFLYLAGKKVGRKNFPLVMLFFALLSVVIFPVLPAAILLLADMLALIDSFLKPKRVYRSILVFACSFEAFYVAMLGESFVPEYIYSFLLLFVLTDVLIELIGSMREKESGKNVYGFADAREANVVSTKKTAVKAETVKESGKRKELGQTGKNQKKETKTESGKPQKKFPMIDVGYFILINLIGISLRVVFRHFESNDYIHCFVPWISHFTDGSGFRGIAGDFYNYPPLYMYMMYLVSLVPTAPLYPLKFVSCLWDVALSFFGMGTIWEMTKDRKKALFAYGLLLCLPTVVSNSAMFTQCDVMYVALIIGSLWMYVKDKPRASMLFYAFAFSLKMQIFFVLPVYVYLWVKKKYKIGQFLYLPAVYVLLCIPAVCAGKSFKELLLLYVGQAQQEPWMMSWYWPNIYQFFGPHHFYPFFAKAGMYGAIAAVMVLLYYMAKRLDDSSPKLVLKMMFCYSLLIPFFLPYMHERYGYLADVLACLVFLIWPKKVYLAITQVIISYAAYVSHLHEESVVPSAAYCIPMLILVLISVYQVFAKEDGVFHDKREKYSQ